MYARIVSTELKKMKHAFNYCFCLFSSRCFEFLEGWNDFLMSVSPTPCIKKVVFYQGQNNGSAGKGTVTPMVSNPIPWAHFLEPTQRWKERTGSTNFVSDLHTCTHMHAYKYSLSLKNFKTYKVVFKTNRCKMSTEWMSKYKILRNTRYNPGIKQDLKSQELIYFLISETLWDRTGPLILPVRK